MTQYFFCGELTDSVAKWYDGVPGTVSINYNDEKPTYAGGKLSKIKRIIIFWIFFISNHIVINNCFYLPLLRKAYYHVNNIRMESNNKLKEIDIKKKKKCEYYYFDNIISINDLDLDNILLSW